MQLLYVAYWAVNRIQMQVLHVGGEENQVKLKLSRWLGLVVGFLCVVESTF